MDYPEQYRTQTLNAIQSVDLSKVMQAIQMFNEARTHGRRIFVCGDGNVGSKAAQSLCDMVKGANFNRSSRFRILALSDERASREQTSDARVFVEQLKNFAEPEDVVMGVCTSGNSPNVVNAIEYAAWIGCRTIAVTGCDGGRMAELAELNLRVSSTHVGSVEDAQMIICHIIGYYFTDVEKV